MTSSNELRFRDAVALGDAQTRSVIARNSFPAELRFGGGTRRLERGGFLRELIRLKPVPILHYENALERHRWPVPMVAIAGLAAVGRAPENPVVALQMASQEFQNSV